MGLKVWFRDDLRDTLAALSVTVVTGDGPLSDYDRGRLAMLASVAVAFGVDVSELGGVTVFPGATSYPGGSSIPVEFEVKGAQRREAIVTLD